MGELRQSFDPATHHLWSRANVGRKVYISDTVRLRGDTRNAHVGANAHLMDYCVLLADAPLYVGAGARVGYGAIIAAHAPVQVCANARVGNNAQLLAGVLGPDGWETGPITIGTGAVIGPGAVIMPGTTIEAGAHVAPNEVVNHAGGLQCVRAPTVQS